VLDARTHEEVTDPIVLPASGYPDSDGLALPAGVAWSVAWTPDTSRLLIGTDDAPGEPYTGEIVAVDTGTWQAVDRIEVPVVPEVMAMDHGDRWLAVSGGEGSSLVFLDPSTLDMHHDVELRSGDRVTAMSFSDDGRYLAAGGESGGLQIADTQGWETREPVLTQNGWLLQMEWLSDDRTVVTTGTG
jgi:WD40 repeat protein